MSVALAPARRLNGYAIERVYAHGRLIDVHLLRTETSAIRPPHAGAGSVEAPSGSYTLTSLHRSRRQTGALVIIGRWVCWGILMFGKRGRR